MPGEEHHTDKFVMGISVAAFAVGVLAAWSVYLRGIPNPSRMASQWSGARAFQERRYLDEFYLWFIDKFFYPLTRLLSWFDDNVLDKGIVDGAGWLATQLSRFQRWFDDVVVDGILVNGTGHVSQAFNAGARLLQSGFVQFYLLAVAFGLSVLFLWAVRAFG
jgi:NADH:ubiquinone oxidoreductase subunit 5 (subunit L)/multisubunit Na+/H+ antiporter MnhA subunit